MIINPLLPLLSLVAEPDSVPLPATWFERFGFPSGLPLLMLVAIYKLSRGVIAELKGPIKDWFTEQTKFMEAIRTAIPEANRNLDERTEVMAELALGQTVIRRNTEEILALTRAQQGDPK